MVVGVKVDEAVSPHTAMIGVDTGISFASFLRFWAVAARRNSSQARSSSSQSVERPNNLAPDRRAHIAKLIEDNRAHPDDD
jgi:hypothetical protein